MPRTRASWKNQKNKIKPDWSGALVYDRGRGRREGQARTPTSPLGVGSTFKPICTHILYITRRNISAVRYGTITVAHAHTHSRYCRTVVAVSQFVFLFLIGTPPLPLPPSPPSSRGPSLTRAHEERHLTSKEIALVHNVVIVVIVIRGRSDGRTGPWAALA